MRRRRSEIRSERPNSNMRQLIRNRSARLLSLNLIRLLLTILRDSNWEFHRSIWMLKTKLSRNSLCKLSFRRLVTRKSIEICILIWSNLSVLRLSKKKIEVRFLQVLRLSNLILLKRSELNVKILLRNSLKNIQLKTFQMKRTLWTTRTRRRKRSTEI